MGSGTYGYIFAPDDVLQKETLNPKGKLLSMRTWIDLKKIF